MPLPLIIVPVFNALEHLERCLDSIEATVPPDTPMVLLDDASTDVRVRPLLQSWVSRAKTHRQLLLHEQNQGFVATANHGMSEAATDVVLLNSDTVVSTGWLQCLARCLASDGSIATATPWSNNGEIVSIPRFCGSNPAPEKPSDIAMAIAGCGSPGYPDIPTAVGFCMAISLRAIKQVGTFDVETFNHGYGEENDFSRRAVALGLRNVLCDDAYVVHHGGASFRPLGLQPDQKTMQRLLKKHPDYEREVSEFIMADPLKSRREEILDCLERTGVRMG